jgi:1-acyl-sn-glycerol-3-phosphate acyltransferase
LTREIRDEFPTADEMITSAGKLDPVAQLGPIRTSVVKIAAALVTAVLGSTAGAVGLVSQPGAARIAHLWGRLCLRLAGVPVKVEGLDHIEDDRRYVIMANHESSLDIVVLLTALPVSVELRFLAKKSLFAIPFLGWAMKSAGFIPVDRENRSTAAATLRQTLDEVDRGGSPLVFPEETWTTDGRLLPFARGGFLVALKSGLPILPIGLEGPRLVLPPGKGLIRPRRVTVRIGEPIATTDVGVSRLREIMSLTRSRIDELRGLDGHVADEQGDHSPTPSG